MPSPIDLRSDTVTQPCEEMRAAMAQAAVGDDVYGDDPTIDELQRRAAQMLGKQAGLFLPSGTQSNLAAVMAHCARGNEYIIGDQYHVFRHEAVGTSVLGSVAPFPIQTQADGSLLATDVAAAIKPDDAHYPVSRLLCLENTVSGKPLSAAKLTAPAKAARDAGLHVHMDGARFFNAACALQEDPAALAAVADTVSVCLSKGLGAPVGSVLVGDRETIARAHRIRKMLGGGMRQAGIIAAAGLFALKNNTERLSRDHERAAALADALNTLSALWQAPALAHTNMVFVHAQAAIRDDLAAHLRGDDLRISWGRPLTRLVLHKDIDDAKMQRVIESFASFSHGL